MIIMGKSRQVESGIRHMRLLSALRRLCDAEYRLKAAKATVKSRAVVDEAQNDALHCTKHEMSR